MRIDKGFYTVHTSDRIKPGNEIEINHSVSIDLEKANAGITDLISLPLETLESKREESAKSENALFEQLVKSVDKWEEQASVTLLINKAIEYCKAPGVSHSSNKWIEEQSHRRSISNAVYRMSFEIWEITSYNREKQESETVAWSLSWGLRVQTPNNKYYCPEHIKIAGQDRKKFTDKAAMEKYIAGRAMAYSHLFKEIYPPVPESYSRFFEVSGILLPGYTLAKDEAANLNANGAAASLSENGADRPQNSVLARIAADKEAKRNKSAKNQAEAESKMEAENSAEAKSQTEAETAPNSTDSEIATDDKENKGNKRRGKDNTELC